MNLARDRDVINTAKTEGKSEARIEFAKALKAKQIALEIIQETTGLTQQEIENL